MTRVPALLPGQLSIYLHVLFVVVPKYGLYHPTVFVSASFIAASRTRSLVGDGRVHPQDWVVADLPEPIEQSILAAFIIGIVLMANMYFRPM